VFTAVYTGVFRERLRFPMAWVLLPASVLVVWVANVARLTALILLGSGLSPDLGVRGFHSLAGVALFCVTALGVVSVSQRWRWIAREAPDPAPTAAADTRAAPYLLPLIVLVATGLVTTAFPIPLDQLHPARFVATAAVLAYFWRDYPLGGSPRWVAIAGGVLAWVLFEWGRLVPSDPARDATLFADWSALPVFWAWLLLLSRIAGTVVLAPLVEELAFRGYLTRRLSVRDGRLPPLGAFTWTGFVGSTVVFGLLHSEWLGALLAGAVYALVLYRTRRLIDPLVAHAVTNGIVVAYALSSGRYSSWL
jgi:exosortase E/protease (VPEID-CTERM system)